MAIKTMRIDEELMEIWPNEVCDTGILLLSAVSLPLPVFCTPPPLVFSAPPFLPLCGLDTQSVPSLPAVKAGFPPQHVFSPNQPRKTRHWSQKG